MSTNINELCSYRKCPALLNYGFLITFKMSLYVYFIYACFLFRKLASKHVLMRGRVYKLLWGRVKKEFQILTLKAVKEN